VSGKKRVVVAAPAKLNLCLHVGSRRADGYHELESLVVFATVGDQIVLDADDRFSLFVEGPFALGGGEDNLAMRAAGLLASHAGVKRGVRICLTKNLPIAAGLGGGSADAAAVLRGLVRLWDLDLSHKDLRELGASLGADVPVCIDSAPAWMEGKGEHIRSLASLPPLCLLLVNPGIPVPTMQVFANLRDRRGLGAVCPEFSDAAALLQFLRSTTNDLEPPARGIAPEVEQVLSELATLPGALLSRMSGSGATCFGVFASDDELTRAAATLDVRHPEWWIRRSAIAAEGVAAPAII
jgi:4-diphosphocytidyl-2-C-methyl-D-erythritol kinase